MGRCRKADLWKHQGCQRGAKWGRCFATWGEVSMLDRSLLAALALTAALCFESPGTLAQDLSKYPDLRGAWLRVATPGVPGPSSFDQTKSPGLRQQAPLTPEYQKILEDSIKDQQEGGQGLFFDHS